MRIAASAFRNNTEEANDNIIPLATTAQTLEERSHQTAVEAFQSMLDSQRKELAEKDAALQSMKNYNRDITISTVAVEKLTGKILNFKTVEEWSLQFLTNIHLNVMENISVDSRESIEYEANRRGLTVGDEWTTLPKDDILLIIKACCPQKFEGLELSSSQQIEKMKANAHLFMPGEKGGPTFIQDGLHFCNLLPDHKARDIPLQRNWVNQIWGKFRKEMKLKAALKFKVEECNYLKDFIYLLGKYHYDIAQQNIAITDNGFIVTADDRFGFFPPKGKGKDDGRKEDARKGDKQSINDDPVTPCEICGRTTEVRINGKSFPHTKSNCFCRNHCDSNTTSLPWSKSPNGLTFKSLGLKSLPHNKKLSADRKSIID
jgi:nicotinamide mononucleotide adenylyltransferase